MEPGRRVVFWDFDGTLARRENLWSGALADAWESVGGSPAISPTELRPFLSDRFPWHTPDEVRTPGTAENWWQALHAVFLGAFVGAGGSPTLAEAAVAAVPASFYRTGAWTPIDGAVEALGITKAAGYRNVILSNHAPELPSLVAALGLSDLVDLTITSAAVGAEKPNRAIFEHAMRAAGVKPTDDTWMVGDNPVADVEGARALGIRALLADGDYPDSIGITVLEAAQHITVLSVR
jgi:putative hydrolase of the HAD superfamily